MRLIVFYRQLLLQFCSRPTSPGAFASYIILWYGAPFRTKVFENQNSCRESDKSIRESEFVVRIGQKYSGISIHVENIEQKFSRIRFHVENRAKVFENQNSWRESDKTIRESEFMARIEQKYSRIKIHGEN